jgi:hypothetical protein
MTQYIKIFVTMLTSFPVAKNSWLSCGGRVKQQGAVFFEMKEVLNITHFSHAIIYYTVIL